MVRRIKKEGGITLIEIIVVIAIIAVILSISIPYYTKWKKRMSVESDTKKIYGVLQTYRMKAFTEKKEFYIKLKGKKLEVYDKNKGKVFTISLENNFKFTGDSTQQIDIDKRGTFYGSSIYAEDYDKADAQYDCVAVDDIRVRLGKYNGDKCVAK